MTDAETRISVIGELVTKLADALGDARTEIDRLRARLLELEIRIAIDAGTLGRAAAIDEAQITHDVPPNAPR